MKTFTVEIQRVYTMHIMEEVEAESEDDARKAVEESMNGGVYDQDFGEMFCDAEPSDSIVEIFETEE